MFERILVPADLTERNREAVAMASRVVAPNGSICLLHVIQTIPGVGVDEEKEFYERLEQKASTFLGEQGNELVVSSKLAEPKPRQRQPRNRRCGQYESERETSMCGWTFILASLSCNRD